MSEENKAMFDELQRSIKSRINSLFTFKGDEVSNVTGVLSILRKACLYETGNQRAEYRREAMLCDKIKDDYGLRLIYPTSSGDRRVTTLGIAFDMGVFIYHKAYETSYNLFFPMDSAMPVQVWFAGGENFFSIKDPEKWEEVSSKEFFEADWEPIIPIMYRAKTIIREKPEQPEFNPAPSI